MNTSLVLLKCLAKLALNNLTGGVGGDVLDAATDLWQSYSSQTSERTRLEDARQIAGTNPKQFASLLKEALADLDLHKNPELARQLSDALGETKADLARRSGMPLRSVQDLQSLLPAIRRIDFDRDPQPRYPTGLNLDRFEAIKYLTNQGVFILFPFESERFVLPTGTIMKGMMHDVYEVIKRCFDVTDGAHGLGIGILIEDPDDKPFKQEVTQPLWRAFMRAQHQGRTIHEVLLNVNARYALPRNPAEYARAIGYK